MFFVFLRAFSSPFGQSLFLIHIAIFQDAISSLYFNQLPTYTLKILYQYSNMGDLFKDIWTDKVVDHTVAQLKQDSLSRSKVDQ